MYHLLGGNFEKIETKVHKSKNDGAGDSEKIDNGPAYFKSKDDNGLLIKQNLPIKLDGGKRKRCVPDISIYYSDKLHAIISIKIVLPHGEDDINTEIEILKDVRNKYNTDMKALLIIFLLPEKSKNQTLLNGKKEDNENWFNFLVLNDPNKKDHLFKNELKWVTDGLPKKHAV